MVWQPSARPAPAARAAAAAAAAAAASGGRALVGRQLILSKRRQPSRHALLCAEQSSLSRGRRDRRSGRTGGGAIPQP